MDIIIITGGAEVKNNAAIREFKKYKSQINQIEEIIEHSKPGALIEHESSVRKKLRHLNQLKIDLKDYLGIPKNSVYGSYSENKKTFSVKFKSIHRVYMFIFLMIHNCNIYFYFK